MNQKNMDDDLLDVLGLGDDEDEVFVDADNRRILIEGEITQKIVQQAVMPLISMDSDGTGEPIEIFIHSLGGSALDGLVLCDVIDRLKTHTTIIVLGYAFSMGCIILSAGKHNPNVHKVCYPFSVGLLHDGSSNFAGSVGDVKDTYKFYNKIDTKIKKYILHNTNITEKEYSAMERKQWYMDANTMLKYGLVDEIL